MKSCTRTPRHPARLCAAATVVILWGNRSPITEGGPLPTSDTKPTVTSSRAAGGSGDSGERDARGRVAILQDDLPVGGDGVAEGVPSSPSVLADMLHRAGFRTDRMDARNLADHRVLNRGRFDVLILPYGPSFPVEAADNLRRFLREGGKLITLGGYAFDNLLVKQDGRWQGYQAAPPSGPSDARWHFDIPAEDIRAAGPLTFSGWVRTEGVAGEKFAFLAVYQYDAAGHLLEFKDVAQVRGTVAWQRHTHTFRVNPRTARVTLYAGMWQCRGQAWFDEVQLLDAAGQVVVDAPIQPDSDPDGSRARSWGRSDKVLCTFDSSTRRGSPAGLKVRLNYVHVEERLNTRHGRPADGLEVEPTQLGVFDPDYRIRRARRVRPAPDQHVFDARWSIDATSADRPISGYAACAVLGYNAARWRPLINAYDGYGRLRGAAGAIVHHANGQWKGSSWAIFGLTSHDVFAPARPGAEAALVRLVEHLLRDVYLVSVLCDKACYGPDETVRVTVRVFNGGRGPFRLGLHASVLPGDQDTPVHRHHEALVAAPGVATDCTFDWSLVRPDQDFYRIRADLVSGPESADRIDILEGGFVVRQDHVLAAGPKLTYRDNYLHVDDRPVFLFGTDDWSYVFTTDRETPLQWRRDMAKRRDFGVTIYENLQIGLPDSPSAQQRFFNQVEGLVQLAQHYRQVYFPCLLCGYDVAVDEATLRRQADFAGAFAERFARVPGLIYYLNGDLRCHIKPAVQPQLDAFLRGRYGSDGALREAWGAPDVRIGQVPAQEYPETNAPWSDVRAYDVNLFRAALIRRWHDALIDAVRRHDTVHPTTSEFYQLPWVGVDVPAAIGRLDLSNIGYFDEPVRDIRRLPSVLKYSDLRARGKSFGPGEYGVKTHPAWRDPTAQGYHKTRTHEQAIDVFLAVAHYALGLGASRIHNWCWKDSSHWVFPWGMNYPCDEVEKDTAYVHRNQSLLFRHVRPVYEAPLVHVMTPDTHRLGGQKTRVIEGILNAIQLVLGCHVDSLGMLNEHHVVIPPSAKVIFLPIPFCLTDAPYQQLLGFVRAGGTLYVSGDMSFDPLRRRTQRDRLMALCGVRFIRERYANIDFEKSPAEDLHPVDPHWPVIPGARPCIEIEPAGAEPLYRTPDGRPVVFRHVLGRGRVLFNADPIELRTDRTTLAPHIPLYRRVLAEGGVTPSPIEPDQPDLHVLRVPLVDRGQVVVFFNADEEAPQRTVRWRGPHGTLTFGIRRQRPALVWYDGNGQLRAAEVQGDLRCDDRLILSDGTDGIVFALDRRDLRDSTAILLMPLRAGRIVLNGRAGLQNAAVEVGEVREGHWCAFELRPPRETPEGLLVDVGDDHAFSLLLLCERSKLPEWRQTVRQAMLDPAACE